MVCCRSKFRRGSIVCRRSKAPPPPTGQQNTVFCRPDTATEATTALLEIGHLYALYGKVIIAIVYRELELFALLVVIQFLSER